MAVMTLCFFSFLTGVLIGVTMALKGEAFRFAGDVAAILPAPVKKTVVALARSSPARAAADALVGLFLGMVCVMFTATFFNVVASLACDGDCSLAGILSEISDYSETLSLLLLAPASALFFLRAAGYSSEVKEDFNEQPSSSLLESLKSPARLAVATAGLFFGIISWILRMCGSPQISDIPGVAALFFLHLFIVLFYISAARALWRMNRRPAIDMVAE
ncbi:uncharacterized protein [Aegilops tauschii subsp. strangulata]|nr:uncharacterized protein LOC109757200 [Aegilops tauschii subsp. strangulata]XP_044416266.1 uncharacterized protein LOC123141102 [Triticum aestivum]XP_044416267.1 uncharacterized protein LOC123141102 [Triticum aestivum]